MKVDIRRTTVIDAPVDELWTILRDFNGHAGWHPAVETSRIEGGETGDQIGAVRDFKLTDGSRIREQLLYLSDSRLSFGYCILEAPSPLRNYVAHVRLRTIAGERACLWEGRASFDPPAPQRDRLARFVRDDIIEAGFAAMRSFLRGERSGSVIVPAAPPTNAAPG